MEKKESLLHIRSWRILIMNRHILFWRKKNITICLRGFGSEHYYQLITSFTTSCWKEEEKLDTFGEKRVRPYVYKAILKTIFRLSERIFIRINENVKIRQFWNGTTKETKGRSSGQTPFTITTKITITARPKKTNF